MQSFRRPLVALVATVVLVVVQALLDPTGLLALVGFSGAQPVFDRGLWPLAPYVVYVPVLLAVVWWAALRAGDRYWTLVPGVVLAVLIAQAATALAMTGDVANAAWSAGYVTIKAVPAALLVAAAARIFGGRSERSRREPGAVLLPSLALAAIAPLVAGHWWTAVPFAPGVPVARPGSGILSVLVAMALIAAATALCLRWMRARVPGVLGGWLAALVAGALVGTVQAVVAFVVDGMPSADLWPFMAWYVAVADGLSFGASLGWVVGLAAVAADRLPALAARRAPAIGVAAFGVLALVVGVAAPVAADESGGAQGRTP
ncbi:hypothetical protein GB864_07975, partial [Agromyces sp. MMS17-SY077]